MQVAGLIDADLDDETAAKLWSASGARWLTDPEVRTPSDLVRRLVGLVAFLDDRGAGLAEVVGSAGVGFLAERAASIGLPRGGRVSVGGASHLIRCSDEWISLSLARHEDVGLVPALLRDGRQLATEVWDVVHEAARSWCAEELVARARLLGLPSGVLGQVIDGRPALAEQLGQAEPLARLDELVVLNLASLWAGPLAADVLARLGARVIKVESTKRPDGGRLARKFFFALHGRAESVALDFSGAEGRDHLRRLIHAADVVIEGSRPRALEQIGIRVEDEMRSETGPRLWMSITAYGRQDGLRDWVGFGDDCAATGGLFGQVGEEPRFVADAVADPLTGLTAAATTVDLLERGGRWLVDVALTRTSRSVAGGWVQRDSGESERPKARLDAGSALPLGRDTESVLSSLGGLSL